MHRLSKLNNASQQKHTLNPISDTAFFTCGARAADARAVIPVCGDFYAERFLDKHGCRIFEGFKRQTGACDGIVARHRIIDYLLRDLLVRDPATSVIVIGAGFDSRAFRLLGGDWTELDESSIIDLKNLRLPVAQCPNPLRRIAIDFAHQELSACLPEPAPGTPSVVVMEGVFIYLSEARITATLDALRRAFPGHALICDLNTRLFCTLYGASIVRQIDTLGAHFRYLVDEPTQIFRLAGYQLETAVSIVGKTLEYANNLAMLFLANCCTNSLLHGYAVHVFHTPKIEGLCQS